MTILRELMRGVRLDPRSIIGASLETIQAELRHNPVCIDISDLPVSALQPKTGDEQARAPFPLCWIEGRADALREGTRFAALVEWQDLPAALAYRDRLFEQAKVLGERARLFELESASLGIGGALHLRCYTAIMGGKLVAVMGDTWVPVDAGGNCFPGHDGGTLKVVSVHKAALAFEGSHVEATENNLAVMGARVVGLFALLNCRNVGLASSHPEHRRKAKRHGKVGIDWKVLHIKPLGGRSASTSKGPGDLLTRAHLVRGHFKTFTAERPLLGRAVGRFWWSPMVRGNAERGAVLKDYAVDAAGSPPR